MHLNNMKENLSRIKKIHFIILIFAIVIVLASIRWQIVDASRLSKIAKERNSTTQINSVRGTIYSKDGTTLAYSEPRFDLEIWSKNLEYYESLKIQTREEFVNKVAPLIDMTPEALAEKIQGYINNDKNHIGVSIPLAKSLPSDQWQKLNNLRTDKYDDLPLVRATDFHNTSKRVYPEKKLASHIIGLADVVGDKTIGKGGLEMSWNEILNPTKGVLIAETNAKGEAVATALTATVEPKNGSSLFTSIDKKLQEVVELKIKEGVEKYQATSGSVVIMDPKTGEIMALANYPDYEPNLREEKDIGVYTNIVVSSAYEWGSIGKALTISAAVDLDRVDQNTIIMPEGHKGCEKFSDELPPLCTADKKPQGPMKLKDCFAKSDNLCLYHLAKEHMSKKEFYDYLVKFGIGKNTGIDLAGEAPGFLRSLDEWTIGDVAAYSFGHGYSVQMIQAIASVGAIANNGVRMKPYLVTKLVDSEGKVNEYKPQVIETVISKETSSQVVNMMRYNYEKSIANGEYWYNPLKKYDLGVKSGTALIATFNEKTGKIDYLKGEINASFVGFDASPQRTFIMLIRLDRPQIPKGDNLAFYNVRPLWLDTFNAVKDIIGVPKK